MKILIVGALGKGALENYYIKGIKRCGAECEGFDVTDRYYSSIGKTKLHRALNKVYPNYFYEPINKSLLEYTNGKHFDAIIVFKGLTLFPDTVRALKRYCKIVCCYNPDHPFKFFMPGSGNKNILSSISIYDLYISYSRRIVAELKASYNVEAFVLPFGFDDDVKPSDKPFAAAINKFSFIGAYDKERCAILELLQTPKLILFGDVKWGTRTSPVSKLRKLYAGKSLFDQDYVDAISTSDAVFNFLRQQNLEEGSHNMRSFEVPGYGGVLISTRTEEQLSFFEDGKEAIYFESIDELNDKLKFLEGKPDYIRKIKQNALARSIKSDYSYSHRSASLMAKIRELV